MSRDELGTFKTRYGFGVIGKLMIALEFLFNSRI